ncbi:MAG: fatty acid CoA ligase family protein [Planctomycetia bacterium]|nr:fatty acid CoA ligase family protein [Planctomycetia bacterium]
MNDNHLNIAQRLVDMAQQIPDNIAIAQPEFRGKRPLRNPYGKRVYRVVTFRELDADSDRIAWAMRHNGLKPGMKIALLVRQGIDFITLVFALYKAGAVLILIDPGMGLKGMLRCLKEAEPDGFVAIPAAMAVRLWYRRWFPKAKFFLTVGRRWGWSGMTLKQAREETSSEPLCHPTAPDDPAAIIFTSGSTGVAKGVLYTHRIFDTQVSQIAARLQIKPGEIDLAGFPFFGLFNAAHGTTAVLPDMDPTRPAQINPELFLEAARDWKVTQSFGSPALWNRVTDYCLAHNIRIATLKRAISAGAPIQFSLLEKMKKCIHPEGEIYTPYGATEALPVAVISATEVLTETRPKTEAGAGICVGKKFPTLRWKVITITDDPLDWDELEVCLPGTVGELLVSGPQVTRRYVTRIDANALAKIVDQSGTVWHRMGDVGYLDDQDRFWFCGRKAHRVVSEQGSFFSIPCESVTNRSPKVRRSALAGIPLPGARQTNLRIPVMIVEPKPEYCPKNASEKEFFLLEMRVLLKNAALTREINHVLIHPNFPVDVRHNAKINREKLSEWAATQIH